MKRFFNKKIFFLLAVFFNILIFSLPAHARADAFVKYNASQKGYFLYEASGSPVHKQGLYKISNKQANGKTFDGIYFVSGKGWIFTAANVHYVAKARTIDKTTYTRGYYYFGRGGKLSSRKGVARLKNASSNNQKFKGYYYYNELGKIKQESNGLIYLDCRADNGIHFKGYYYREAMSRINLNRGIRKITGRGSLDKQFSGYHFFGKGGKMDTSQSSRRLNLTYKGTKYQGYYCFAGTDGRMVRKKGLVVLSDTCYYVINNKGKCFTGGEKTIKGLAYSFQPNGKGRLISTNLSGLYTQLNSMIGSYGGIWSVYVKRMDNSDSLTINDVPLYAASLIKAFVMASAYDQIKEGNLEETATVNSLLHAMITVSSNEAYNEMVMWQAPDHNFLTGRLVVSNYLDRNFYNNTQIHCSYGSTYISDGQSINYTSVTDCAKLLESIYRGTCVDRASSGKMLNLLLSQQRRSKIPAGLPSGTKVGNKTGETSSCDHDIAIVYGPSCTYILCVMSQNSANSVYKVSQISKAVYQYLN